VLLIEFKEFFPFAAAVNWKGEVIPITNYFGEEHPLSNSVIQYFESLLDQQLSNGEIRSYALAYDVRVSPNGIDEPTDAILVKIKHDIKIEPSIYYFAYRISGNNIIERLNNWKEGNNS